MQEELLNVLQTFSKFLSSETAKQIFKNLSFKNAKELEDNIVLSKEIKKFTEECQSIYFMELFDVREAILSSQKNYVLDRLDIFCIYQSLIQWDNIRNIEIEEKHYPLLHQLIHQIILPNNLLQFWKSAFDDQGNISDSASPELKRIRGLKYQLRKSIEKILQKQLGVNEDLAEHRIAFREDRYVLPIKSSAKNRSNGIIHGFSSSGLVAYIEPKEIVPLNNELLSVDDLEQQEINRLLRLWSNQVAEYALDLHLIVERSAELEILFAKIHFAKKYQALFSEISTSNSLLLKKVYNPFLLIQKGKEQTRPITLEIKDNIKGVIISGPNAGGKSAALKTSVLCLQMFLKGLPIPSEESKLPFFKQIFIEIGDSQSLNNDLSTFSGHLYHIKDILNRCDSDSIVFIDEIAHATDPLEGEALGCAIIDELIDKNTLFMITTHYKKIKLKALEHKNIQTYAASFNTQTLMPEYTLYPNTIGESYALKIAGRVGINENIIKNAESILQFDKNHTDVILNNIEEFEQKLRSKEIFLKKIEEQLADKEIFISELEKELSKQKKLLLNKGLEVADQELDHCLKELAAIQRNIDKQPKQASKKLYRIKEKINEKKSEITNLSRQKMTSIKVGDFVFIASLNKKATIEEISKDRILVSIGNIKISVKHNDIFQLSEQEKKINNIPLISKGLSNITHSVDIHGLTSEEAIKKVEQYLYPAMAAGLKEFTIIHGKGTGVLQKTIHNLLKQIPEVKDFSFATPELGGSGKTIVRFI